MAVSEWLEHETKTLVEQWEQGKCASAIAKMLPGRNRDSVLSRVKYLRKKGVDMGERKRGRPHGAVTKERSDKGVSRGSYRNGAAAHDIEYGGKQFLLRECGKSVLAEYRNRNAALMSFRERVASGQNVEVYDTVSRSVISK